MRRSVERTRLGSAALEGFNYFKAKRENGFKLGHPPGHFYSPIPSAADLRRAYGRKKILAELAGIDLREDSQLSLIAELGAMDSEVPFGDYSQPGLRYWFTNGFFGRGDAVLLYAMLRHFEPHRVIEVGSGFSSALMLDVNDHWMRGSTRFTFVKPYPDRLNALLRPEDHENVEIFVQPVQDVDPTIFESLESGDILFIDSSHVSKTGSDVNHLVLNVLPLLAAGVIVHFHDVFWPFEYPEEWALRGRAWNEDYLLRAFLSYNDHFEILLYNNWLAQIHSDLVRLSLSNWSKDETGSLWLRVAEKEPRAR
jgi:predicted O-methyltransferase YrrM